MIQLTNVLLMHHMLWDIFSIIERWLHDFPNMKKRCIFMRTLCAELGIWKNFKDIRIK
jgi:hypothetical protein